MSDAPDANRAGGPDRDARSDPNGGSDPDAETQVVRQPPDQWPDRTLEMPAPTPRRETEREVVREPVQDRRVVREPVAREREVVREPVARPVAREREVVRDRPPARRREVTGGGMGSGALVALILLTVVALFIAYLLVQAVSA